jgi:cytochrome c oxidase subunit II
MKRCWAAIALVLLSGCAGVHQSAVDAAGTQASKIEWLFWSFTILLSAIFVIVIGFTLWTLVRRHRGFDQERLEVTHAPSGATEERLKRVVIGATVLTVVILFGLLIASVTTGKALAEIGNKENAIAVEITGNQWWWYVRYLDQDASRVLGTANELHIPVGRPVMIRGTSNDVIHSFWVPNLHGKRDLIPSRVTTEWIQADRPGRFRGQCAEFCGTQHAHMALWVVAEPEAQFQEWMKHQLEPSATPSDPNLLHGQQVFLGSSCIMCHTIRGTSASGQVAPDLTHLGSRMTIAAGTLPNNKGSLGGWVTDPQNIKPGNHMATVDLKAEDLQSLLDYLESLK